MRNKSVYEWLSHPLLLLLIGALVSSYLIPMLTRGWQNHQKQLELKTVLVTQIGEEVTDFLMAVQFAEMGSTSQSPQDYDMAYRAWEIESAKLGALLSAYFPQTTIGEDWREFSEVLTDFYALSGAAQPADRQYLLDRMRNAAFLTNAPVDWAALAQRGDNYAQHRLALHNQLAAGRDAIIRAILDARIVSF